MQKLKMNAYYLAVLVCLVILVSAGGCITDTTSSQTSDTTTAIQSSPTTTTTHPASPAESPSGSMQKPGSECSSESRINIPVDTSIPIQDPMPGIRYSLNESASGRTIVLGKGDIVEINLRFAPGLAMRWTVPVSGCGIELVNAGTYSNGGDFWNVTDYYRARYRAVSPGTSVLNGKLSIFPNENPPGAPRFNLTVIVK
nr:hypothetical protein [uncultured Methanoregula sp.]